MNIEEDKSITGSLYDERLVCENGLIQARISEVQKERYCVLCRFGEGYARLKGSVFFSGLTDTVYPAVGDYVLMEHNAMGDSVIYEVLPRKSLFSRRNPTPGMGEQAVAANFDFCFLVMSLNQNFNLRRLERYLTAAWQSGGTPVVVLTKADLCEDVGKKISEVQKIAPGVDVIPVSAYTGEGILELAPYLVPGKTSVLLGSSGVGKSSLVNRLAGAQLVKVSEIREEDGRGRHTTTYRQLITLPGGAMVIDTPGMRELGMWDVSDGLVEAFTDIDELSAHCRFSDCKHGDEPGCAVREAIRSGELPAERWSNYNKLKREAHFEEKKAAFIRNKIERGNTVEKYQRERKKEWLE